MMAAQSVLFRSVTWAMSGLMAAVLLAVQPAQAQTTSYSSTKAPETIPLTEFRVIDFPIDVTDNVVINSLTLTTNLYVMLIGFADIFLIAPDGTQISVVDWACPSGPISFGERVYQDPSSANPVSTGGIPATYTFADGGTALGTFDSATGRGVPGDSACDDVWADWPVNPATQPTWPTAPISTTQLWNEVGAFVKLPDGPNYAPMYGNFSEFFGKNARGTWTVRFRIWNTGSSASWVQGPRQVNSATLNIGGTVDTTPPVFSNVPADFSVEATSTSGAVVTLTPPTAVDAVDGSVTVTTAPTPGTIRPLGTTTYIYTATDSSGNTATDQTIVTVIDTTPPTVVAPADITAEATSATGAVVSFTPTVTDIADGAPTVTYAPLAPGATFPIGTTQVTITATDASGNSAQATFDVTVQDTTPPVIDPLSDITVNTDAGQSYATVSFTPTATDAVDAAPTLSASPASGTQFPVGTTLVTVTATDATGNSSQTTFNVIVSDAEDPTFANVPGDITQNTDPGQPNAVVTWLLPTASDNVGIVTVTSSHNPGDTFPVGATTVTYAATDAAGNTGTASFLVTIADNEAPVIGPLTDIVVSTPSGQSTAVVSWTPTATDNDGIASLVSSPASGSAFPIGVTTVTVTATDNSGNSSQATFTVTVNDNEGPVVTVPADIVTDTDPGLSTAVVTFTPTATDNDGIASIVSSPASGSAFPIGVTTVIVTATDNSGNASQATFTVTVNDNEAPVVTAPADIVMDTDPGQPNAVVTFTPTATDNDGIASIVSSPASGSAFPIGVTSVTSTATDNSGNSSQATFTVTVNDNEAPVVTVPADISVSTDAGQPTAVVTFTPTATDNDGIASIVSSPASGSAFPVGVTTVTSTATDNSGNTSQDTFTVTVTDNEPPQIVGLPSDITVDVSFPNTSAVVTYTDPTVTDNVPGATIALTGGLASGSSFPLGTTTVEFTATDAAGNAVSVSFAVTVNQTPPGEVTIAVVSDVSDGTFRFSSPTSQFNFNIKTSDGKGQSSTVTIQPGRYVVTAHLPDGFGLASGRCNDTNSRINVNAKKATIRLASTESVTCTFHTADSRTKTVQTIQRFLNRRNDLLLSNGPDRGREISRLMSRVQGGTGDGSGAEFAGSSGGASQANSVATANTLGAASDRATTADVFGASSEGPVAGTSLLDTDRGYAGGDASGFAGEGLFGGRSALGGPLDRASPNSGMTLPFSFNVSGNRGASASFSTSLVGAAQAAAAEKRRKLAGGDADTLQKLGVNPATLIVPQTSALDIWLQGTFVSFDDGSVRGGNDGNFSVVYLGVDYVLSPNLLIGALVQYDHMDETSIEFSSSVAGDGWMVGPYATLRLTDELFFQTRAAWGQSENDISPFLTYTDSFDTTRWLVEGTLQGQWNHSNWSFRPKASISYIEEQQDAYVDSLSVLIPEQTVALGQARFGPEVSYRFATSGGGVIEPYLSLEGIWNFDSSGTTLVADTLATDEEIRGRTELGLKALSIEGIRLDLSGSYDGLGVDDYHAISGKARLAVPMN